MSFEYTHDPYVPIGSDRIYTPINISIGVTFTDEQGGSESIESIEITADLYDSGITLSTTLSSANITGYHTLEIFPNSEIKFLPKGGTDKVDPVTTVQKTTDVPPNKDVFSVKSDSAQSKVVTYTVTARTTSGSVSSESFEYIATQDYSAMRDWLNNYEL